MPIQNGRLFTCSRSASVHKRHGVPQEFIETGDDNAAKRWHEVSFDDHLSVPTDVVLCEECYEKYESMMLTWNRDVQEFMGEGA